MRLEARDCQRKVAREVVNGGEPGSQETRKRARGRSREKVSVRRERASEGGSRVKGIEVAGEEA